MAFLQGLKFIMTENFSKIDIGEKFSDDLLNRDIYGRLTTIQKSARCDILA
jgi:hypothetical protein